MTWTGITTVYLERFQPKKALTTLEKADQYSQVYPFDYNYEKICQANQFSYVYYLTYEYDQAFELLIVVLHLYARTS